MLGSGSSSLRQQDSCLLHPEIGWNSEFSFERRGLSSTEREHSKRHNFTQPPLVSNVRQCVKTISNQNVAKMFRECKFKLPKIKGRSLNEIQEAECDYWFLEIDVMKMRCLIFYFLIL